MVLKQVKPGKNRAEDLKDKFGDKTNMASIIIELANVCLEAKDLLQKMQGHNFDLRGKVADLASTEMKKMREEVLGNQNSIMSRIDEVQEKVADPRSFSEVLGKNLNSASFVLPMKQAMKEIEKDEERGKSLVFHGLDIEPGVPREKQIEQIKDVAEWAVTEILDLEPNDRKKVDVVNMKILGRVGNSGKAPPVLMTMRSASEAQYLIKNANRLSKVDHLRRVFVTEDLSKDAREKRRKVIEDLKKKIKDFPEQRWVIRQGAVTSVGKFTASQSTEEKKLGKSFNYLH